MFFYWMDRYYLFLVIPAMLVAVLAQIQVSSTFSRYQRVHSRRGMTAAEAARRILDANGLHQVRVERVSGRLTDHYDPRSHVIRLSDSVYSSDSVGAIRWLRTSAAMPCSMPSTMPPSSCGPR